MKRVSVVDRASVAREALSEITRPTDVGDLVSETVEPDGSYTLSFAATMLGYPGWHWTVSVAELEGEDPSVLEAELLPGDGALLAPEWVPWSERLEEWRAQQPAETDEDGDEDDYGDEEDEDDFGDDVYDGLDPDESEPYGSGSAPAAPPDAGVDQAGEAEGDADDDRPEPEAATRRQ